MKLIKKTYIANNEACSVMIGGRMITFNRGCRINNEFSNNATFTTTDEKLQAELEKNLAFNYLYMLHKMEELVIEEEKPKEENKQEYKKEEVVEENKETIVITYDNKNTLYNKLVKRIGLDVKLNPDMRLDELKEIAKENNIECKKVI